MASALLLAAAALAGCGSADQAERTAAGGPVDELDRKGDFQGRQAEVFAGTREFCEMDSRAELAASEGLPANSDVAEIARLYASEWPQSLRRAAYQGCKAGLANVPVRFPASVHAARGIWGRNFLGTAITGSGKPPLPRPNGIRVFFGVEQEHSIGWEASCNGFGGDVHFTAAKMEVDDVGSTLLGCEPENVKADQWLSEFMEGDPEWLLRGRRLQLAADGATISLSVYGDPGACHFSRSGGRVNLRNSGLDCESARNLVALHLGGKDDYLQGWTCGDEEAANGQTRVICRDGKKWFAVQAFEPSYQR